MKLIDAKEIKKVVDQIQACFDPEKIILFGSYAYGKPTVDSDVDFLVIMNHKGRDIEIGVEIRTTIDIPFACDLIIQTPQEVRRRYEQFDPIIRHAVQHGKILYERDSSRVA